MVNLTGLSGTYAITIGTGGAGNSNTAQRAGSGNASSFGSIITCNGGQGALGASNGNVGTVTISSGTTLRSISSGSGNQPGLIHEVFVGQSGGVSSNGGTPSTWSVSSQNSAGGGASNYNNGAMSGAIVIEY